MQIWGLIATASHSIGNGRIRKGTDKNTRRRDRKRIRSVMNMCNEDEEKGKRAQVEKVKITRP
jgi:hypothetical protein